MSYILDALKKLEHEKKLKSRSTGSITIAGELFTEERPKSSGFSGRSAAVVILIAVAATFALTWYFIKGGGTKTAEKMGVETKTVIDKQPVQNPLPATVSAPIITPKTIPEPAAVPVKSKAIPPLKQTTQMPAPIHSAVKKVQPKTKPVVTTKSKQQTVTPQSQYSPPPADIAVSGVAWQEERVARRAVINGILMKEGGNIAGAEIKEIRQDRVLFDKGGALFEVPFVSSPFPSTGK